MSPTRENRVKRRKVGFLTGQLALGYGVDLVVHQYATALEADGHHPVVYCFESDDSVARSYEVVSLLEAWGTTDISPIGIPGYAAHLNSLDVDIWVLNTPPFYDFAPFLARPVVSIEYGSPPSRFFPPEIGRILDTGAEYRLKHVYPGFRPEDRIVCISRSIQDWLPRDVRPSSEVVYLGCDHYEKADAASASAFRDTTGLGDGPVVLWVGRVQVVDDKQPYKGFRAFIDMARSVRLAEPRVQFLVVGKGGKAEAEFLRSENVAHRLNLPGAEMGTAFAASDLFVSTSRWEGFNLPLLEAQYQGTPALALAVGPHLEVVADGKTGILVDSPDGMTSALLALIRDTDRRARLSGETERFAGRFSWAKSVAGLEIVIGRSLGLAGSRPARRVSWLTRRTFPLEYYYRRFGLWTLLRRLPTYPLRRLRRSLRRADRN